MQNVNDFETRTQIDEPILKVYQYGSVVYGCQTANSDTDYIVVVDSPEHLYYSVREDDADYTVYSEKTFIRKIGEHHISIMECIFQSESDPYVKHFKLNTDSLRRSISAVSSNSFVKCRKKMRDGDEYTGKKSMFHSLRILMFGIQIAKHGKIIDYGCANDMLQTIMEMKNWEEIRFVCQSIYNELKSEFKLVAQLESEK